MNVMNYKQVNAQSLISFLSMLTVGTCVTIKCYNYATVCFGTISTPKDVLGLCEKCYNEYGHSLRVYEIGIVEDYIGERLEVSCI